MEQGNMEYLWRNYGGRNRSIKAYLVTDEDDDDDDDDDTV